MWHTSPVARVGSFWTRDWTQSPWIGRWTPSHWTTREVPPHFLHSHPSISGRVGYLQFRCNARVKCKCILGILISLLLAIYPKVRLLGHMVFNLFWGTPILFSLTAAPFCIPTNSAQGFPSLYPPTLVNSYLFDNSHSNRCELISYGGSHLHLPNIRCVVHFSHACWPSGVSLKKSLFWPFEFL